MSDLVYCNPFLSERIELERAILLAEFDEDTADWNVHPDWPQPLPNIERLAATSRDLAEDARRRVVDGYRPTAEERELYEDVVILGLYYQHRPELDVVVDCLDNDGPCVLGKTWDSFSRLARHYLDCLEPRPSQRELAQIFAFFFQFCRAFHKVFDCIIGVSPAAIHLRSQVWQSIFTHDLRRYRRVLFERMGDFATLVTGPSGTGKELVARAIGLSRYIPFDPRTKQLTADTAGTFHPLNLSALSLPLIEAELFGHRRGAFTGAVSDRKGWLEVCPKLGSVFLDEIGEIDSSIQVKLLRVLEDRKFSRVGETRDRRFEGKIIAATNRELAKEINAGRFRTDLYYRLCADSIRTPSLHERIVDNDEERHLLLTHLAKRLLGDETDSLVAEVEEWIDTELGRDYPWPGNVRELEQCLRNVMIRREYHPADSRTGPRIDDAYQRLADEMRDSKPTADEVLRRYCGLVYRETGSFAKAAQRLRIDRRTVKAKVGPQAVSQNWSFSVEP